MNFIAIVKLILTLLPLIRDAVDMIEDMFPQGGYGAQKLEMVKTIIEKSITVSDIGAQSFGAIWPIISGVVANIVAMKKTTAHVSSPVLVK